MTHIYKSARVSPYLSAVIVISLVPHILSAQIQPKPAGTAPYNADKTCRDLNKQANDFCALVYSDNASSKDIEKELKFRRYFLSTTDRALDPSVKVPKLPVPRRPQEKIYFFKSGCDPKTKKMRPDEIYVPSDDMGSHGLSYYASTCVKKSLLEGTCGSCGRGVFSIGVLDEPNLLGKTNALACNRTEKKQRNSKSVEYIYTVCREKERLFKKELQKSMRESNEWLKNSLNGFGITPFDSSRQIPSGPDNPGQNSTESRYTPFRSYSDKDRSSSNVEDLTR